MHQHKADFDEESWEQEMAHLVTEDETPVDNRFSERQQSLLPAILYASWPEGKPFEAVSNVGLFYSLHDQPPVVPDFMLSLGVEPRPVSSKKADRSYMTWVYGKPPDLVVEVVSNKEGGELDGKLEIYARVRVTYYVVYDPFLRLGDRELRTYQLVAGRYIEMLSSSWLPAIGLGLVLWEGSIRDVHDRWLRFVDAQGRLLPTPEEQAEQARKDSEQAQNDAAQAREDSKQAQKDAEQAQKDAEQARKDAEQARKDIEQAWLETEKLRSKLRELGVEP